MRLSPLLALGMLFLLFAALTLLPASTPSIEGRVSDEHGPVAGARVRIKGTDASTRTDARGRFQLPPLLPGRTVTAWKDGYLIGGTRSLQTPTIHLSHMPAEDNAAYQWVDPTPNAAEVGNCANCHAEIYREWSQSGHSRSVEGRHFRNLYEGTDWNDTPNVGWGLLTQYPDGSGVCASCHAPTASAYDLRQVKGVAARGVHCDYCHKIAGVEDGPLGLTHGRFNLRLLRPSEGQLFFGALDDVDRGEDVYAPLYRDSRYCASCHEGVVFGVHVYSTFSEWQASPARQAGQHCQDCHMRPTGRMSNIAPHHGGIRRDPHTLANHRFFDGSLETMLRRAVKTSAEFERTPQGVKARVRVWAEGVGHRVPTGFIDRHLLLLVEGQDAEGQPVPVREGPRLPALAGPELAGQGGRLYARILEGSDGRSPAPFWLAAPEPPTDTRLTPGRIDEIQFTYPARLERLRLRILYRRFWPEVARQKKWPQDELLVREQTCSLPPAVR